MTTDTIHDSDILIVDDEIPNLRLLTELLEKEGYQVRPTNKAQTAIDAALAKPPSLILLDVRMPQIDGFEVCRRLKQDEGTQNLPIIFVSALHDVEARVQGFEAGGVDFITKPFQELEILARVKTHISLHRAQQNLEQLVDERTTELRKSREFNRAVLMSMTDHIAVLDKAGYILTVNKNWLDFARENDVSSLELVGEGINYLDACRRASDGSDESAQKALGGIKSVLSGERKRFELEYPCHSPTEQRWYLMQVIPFKGEKGGVVVSHSDISDRKKAEIELKSKEAMLEEAQRIARLGSWNWDIMTDELSWSVEVYRIFGISPQEFGATYEYFLDRIHPDDLESVKNAVQSALADPSADYNIMHRIITPDGEERIVRARGNVTFDDQGKASRMIGTLQDVTDIRQMEMETDKLKAELSHLDRVNTMGVLTAGIAHEINQPLAAILSNAQAAIRFLKKKPQDLKEVKDALQDIISDCKRSGEMVHSIRNIMKRYEPKHRKIDLNDTVREVLILLKSEALNRKVLLSQKLQPDIPPVYGDRIEIQQVTLNIVMNALEALSGQHISSPEIIVSTRFEDNKYVILSVSDSGPGIEPDRFNSIFDAFETTKKGGLGIGLSICRSIADLHGGQIWAENRPGGGANFFLRLPIVNNT